jgi:hypothetical protein
MILSNKREIEIIKKHLDLEKKLLDIFNNSEVNLEDIKIILESFQKLRHETIDKLKLKKEKDISLDFNANFVKDRDFDTELLKSHDNAKNELNSIYNSLKEDLIPTCNLNIFIDFINNFSETIKNKEKIDKIDLDNQILILNEDKEKHNLCLKKGKRIILTKRNFDLSPFNRDELMEILRFLDLIIKDKSYDYLRKEIVSQINSISNVSEIKN